MCQFIENFIDSTLSDKNADYVIAGVQVDGVYSWEFAILALNTILGGRELLSLGIDSKTDATTAEATPSA